MSHTNYNKRTIGLLAATENYFAQEGEPTCEEYDALWESLSVDRLSPEETKRLLEHLLVCPRCREVCAMLHRAGVYKDMPFYDRVREYEKNPEAETDENWKKIAFIFRPELASVDESEPAPPPRGGKVAEVYDGSNLFRPELAPVDESEPVKPPRGGKAAGVYDGSKPGAEGLKRKRSAAWRRLSYFAALFLGVAAGVVWFGGQNPEQPVTQPNVPGRRGFGGNSKGFNSQLVILSFDFGEVNEIYKEGAANFGDEDYATAAEKFALLVEKLRSANGEVDKQALSVARWNLAVAAICSGEVSTGVQVLKEIKAMKLNDAEMNARVDAAIEIYSTSETTW